MYMYVSVYLFVYFCSKPRGYFSKLLKLVCMRVCMCVSVYVCIIPFCTLFLYYSFSK